MVEHVRTRAYDAHVALKDIEELRQLVNIGLPHEVAERKLPRVVLRRLFHVRVLVHVHGPEFIAVESPAEVTDTSKRSKFAIKASMGASL